MTSHADHPLHRLGGALATGGQSAPPRPLEGDTCMVAQGPPPTIAPLGGSKPGNFRNPRLSGYILYLYPKKLLITLAAVASVALAVALERPTGPTR